MSVPVRNISLVSGRKEIVSANQSKSYKLVSMPNDVRASRNPKYWLKVMITCMKLQLQNLCELKENPYLCQCSQWPLPVLVTILPRFAGVHFLFQYLYDQTLMSYNKISRQWRYIFLSFYWYQTNQRLCTKGGEMALTVEKSNLPILLNEIEDEISHTE